MRAALTVPALPAPTGQALPESLAQPVSDWSHRWPLAATGDNPHITANALKERIHDR
jgi:hypothetical protein